MLASFFFGVLDKGGHAVKVVLGEFGSRDVEERRDDLGRGVPKECIEEVTEGGVFGLSGGKAGEEDVFKAFDPMGDVALEFERFEERANSGVRGGIRKGGEDVGSGGGAALIQDVHDLALAPAKGLLFF